MSSPSTPRPAQCVVAVFWSILPGLALFEVGYKALAAFVVKPLLTFLADKTLGQSGAGLAFNERILGALFSPWGLVGGALLAAFTVIAAYYEFSVLFTMAGSAAQGQPVHLVAAMEISLPNLKRLKQWGVFGFAVYTLGLLPLVGLGLSPAILPALSIPNFITGEFEKTLAGNILVKAFYAAVFLVYLLLLFTVPRMILAGERFGRAIRGSFDTLRAAGPANWIKCILFLAAWAVLFHEPGLVPTRFVGITGAGFHELVTNLLAGKLLPNLPAFLLSSGLRIVLSVLFIAMLTVFYMRAGGEVALDLSSLPDVEAKVERTRLFTTEILKRLWKKLRELWAVIQQKPFYQKHKKLIFAAAGLTAVLVVTSVFAAPPVLHAPIAVGHRGSLEGVENTKESVQGAIDAGADYAEIDVLLSKDGVPMVIHDTNLGRLAGRNVDIFDLTAAELSEITLSQNGYQGHISTLGEMLDYCKGKIGLVVELKTHGQETEDIVKRVVQVIEEHGAADSCLFMSISYDIVERLNALRPAYPIGYCVYGSVADVDANALVNNGVDFLTIEENMVAPRFINRCLRAGLPVYVWTVDDADDMHHYLEQGVLGIVSDYPGIAKSETEEYYGEDAKDYYRWQSEWMNGEIQWEDEDFPPDEEEPEPDGGEDDDFSE